MQHIMFSYHDEYDEHTIILVCMKLIYCACKTYNRYIIMVIVIQRVSFVSWYSVCEEDLWRSARVMASHFIVIFSSFSHFLCSGLCKKKKRHSRNSSCCQTKNTVLTERTNSTFWDVSKDTKIFGGSINMHQNRVVATITMIHRCISGWSFSL